MALHIRDAAALFAAVATRARAHYSSMEDRRRPYQPKHSPRIPMKRQCHVCVQPNLCVYPSKRIHAPPACGPIGTKFGTHMQIHLEMVVGEVKKK